jgi:hypothetical protein
MTPSAGQTFTAQALCEAMWLDRRILEQAIHSGQLKVPPVKQGGIRRFDLWDAVNIGVFAEMLRQGIYRRHAARIASEFDFRLLEDREDDGRDLWLLVRPSDNLQPAGRADERFAFNVNTVWAKCNSVGVFLPKVEPQLEGESKLYRRVYFRRIVTALNVSELMRELERYGSVGESSRPLEPDTRETISSTHEGGDD